MNPNALRYLVIQAGARMHYAVPAILARRGMLAEFWTDMHAEDWPARLAGRGLPGPLRTNLVSRMLGRELPPEIPRRSVRSFPMLTLWHRLRGKYVFPSINRRLLKRGFGSATGFYSLMWGDADLISAAKARGLFVAFEQVISPDHPPIMFDERERFPGIEPQHSPEDEAHYLDVHRRIWRDATSILAPSGYVREGIGQIGGDLGRVCLVPYAVDERWFLLQPAPEPGRVLFVGSVGLRKGNHYLAKAARLLAERRVPCQIRVVGPPDGAIAGNPLFAGPQYVGQVPRAEVREEFLRADVFVLPTLVEGSATAHIEALACGLPVITTPNCGTLIRDREEGFIVPIRDAAALADRIEAVVTNRQLRAEMSVRARELAAREHTWERYEERLVRALGPVEATSPAQITSNVRSRASECRRPCH